MAIAFMSAWPHGVIKLISSYEFDTQEQGPPHDDEYAIKNVELNQNGTCRNGWICEHRWPEIFSMVKFRSIVSGK